MPKQFDTNPLDPAFPEKAKAAAETASNGGYTAPSPTPFSTNEFPTVPASVTEEETRRFDSAQFNSYAFQGGQPPAIYQPASLTETSERKVAKTGMPEKWLIGLPYVPFYIGLVASLIMLLVIPKEETKVRFHAAQGFATQIAIAAIAAILGVVGNITDSNFGGFLFGLASTIMLIIWAVKAWKGKPVHIEVLEDLTNWFDDKIGPVKR